MRYLIASARYAQFLPRIPNANSDTVQYYDLRAERVLRCALGASALFDPASRKKSPRNLILRLRIGVCKL